MKIEPAEATGGVMVESGPKRDQAAHPDGEESPSVLPVFHLKRIPVPVDFTDCAAARARVRPGQRFQRIAECDGHRDRAGDESRFLS